MSDIESFATGLTQGINSYLGKRVESQLEEQKQANLERRQEGVLSYKDKLESAGAPGKLAAQEELAKYKSGIGGQLSPEDAELVAPGMGSDWVNSFKETNSRLPTIAEGMKALHEAAVSKKGNTPNTGKADDRQDRLEKQALDRVTQVRGDQSLLRTESQRDGAVSAYKTLDDAIKSGGNLSPAAYYDTLGQLWKARTGASPTDQAIKDLDTKTFQGDVNKVLAYFGGKPTSPGASSTENLKALRDFVAQTGSLMDQQHESYMGPRLLKPTGLDDDRWQPIQKSARGRSFKEATGYDPNNSADSNEPPTVISQAAYQKLPSGTKYKGPDGKLRTKR